MATKTAEETASGVGGAGPVPNRLIFILALLGAGIALYLTWAHARGADIPCGPSRGCETVATSRYSRFLGVPVAAWGAALYLMMASLALTRERDRASARNRTLLHLLLIGAGAGTTVSLYLTYQELFTIRALCLWCLASQILMLAVLGVAAWEWLLRRGVSGEVRLTFGLAIFVLLGAGSLFVLDAVGDLPPPARSKPPQSTSAQGFEVLLKDARHVRGKPDAPLTIIEFADFQCMACRRAYARIASRLGATIPARFVFRHLPLTGLHPRALPAALAVEAAARQGKFWEMYDALFVTKHLEDKERAEAEVAAALSDPALEETAERIGLDMARFRRDWKDPALQDLVDADAALAGANGVVETPTFVIREASGQVTLLTGGDALIQFLGEKSLIPATAR